MPDNHVCVYVHLVWATWDRAPLVKPAVQTWLHGFLADEARRLGSRFVVVGGMADNVHVLTELPTLLCIADLVKQLKGASSRVTNAHAENPLRWQRGYGVFSVGHRERAAVEAYVRNQPAHHGSDGVDADLEATGRNYGSEA